MSIRINYDGNEASKKYKHVNIFMVKEDITLLRSTESIDLILSQMDSIIQGSSGIRFLSFIDTNNDLCYVNIDHIVSVEFEPKDRSIPDP